jgi:hypothetical protein
MLQTSDVINYNVTQGTRVLENTTWCIVHIPPTSNVINYNVTQGIIVPEKTT